ncbi:MAG TPA: PAS domain S-box protein [Geminicoccus sp.]|uniref:hybrid sensor histidine kinase/response regulator n=1 Tax=Geminicoccus sp. TaxID=2024832 RepID=UPI002E33E734|nr:PAS domain S-box protein [Geminicoccus sp.]HEX2528960.1 PAS domain S-box protein [Geminicoccus sp.]
MPARPSGEMASLVRAFDWSRTVLGPMESWPDRLKATVDLILHARIPMALLWGADGVLIYNDGYRAIAGGRHPAILGKKFSDAWPEPARLNAQMLDVVLGGQVLHYRDQHLVLHREHGPEDGWFDLDYSPVVDAQGVPAGVLMVVTETTDTLRTEQRLRMAQESGGIGTFEWYPDTGRLDVSPEFRKIWGFGPHVQVTDRMLMDLVDPIDLPRTGPARIDQANPLEYAEYRIRRADDGELRWIARRGEVITAPGGQLRFLGVSIDITDRKQAEEAVRTSEARWRGLFEQMQEGFYIGDLIRDASDMPVDFRFVEVNPAFEVHTGLPWHAMIGKRVRDVIPGALEHLLPIFARVVETGTPEQFEAQIPALEDRWFEARARLVGGDRFAVLFIDITTRKLIETALAESEARFRSLAQSVPNHVWAAGPDGRLDWFNDRVCRYSGMDAATLSGDGWESIVHPEDQATTTLHWKAALADGSAYQTEFRLRRHDGVYRWHIARALPIRSEDGQIRRWIGTNTDIDDRKSTSDALARLAETLEERVAERTAELTRAHEALRQSQKMEAVGQLTGGIAHDFNNLLQGIVGSLDIVQRRLGQGRVDDVDRFVSGAMASANRAAALTHRLLAFSRRQPLDPKPLRANPLLGSMEDLLRRTIGMSIDLALVTANDLWETLCDANQLESAVLNLAINARDAMPSGGRLMVETSNAWLDEEEAARAGEVRPGPYVCIAVTDTGTGMPPDVVERAFDPFFTTKPIGKGTGLGLSMIYGFTRQSDGFCRIRSEPGRGTTVSLYLPRHQSAAPVEEAAPVRPVAPEVEDGWTVLVVEDDLTVRALVVEILQELGYRTLEASDGPSGLQILESPERIDLLLTDIGLPGLNGRQVASGARACRPDLKVLFMTGYAENAALANGFLGPNMALITKPFPMDGLVDRVRRILNGNME